MSSNGLISFESPFTEPRNGPFSATSSLQMALIAPLWSSLVSDGSTRYFYRVSESPSDLDRIASLITDAIADGSYRPTFAVIATWENIYIHYYRHRVSM